MSREPAPPVVGEAGATPDSVAGGGGNGGIAPGSRTRSEMRRATIRARTGRGIVVRSQPASGPGSMWSRPSSHRSSTSQRTPSVTSARVRASPSSQRSQARTETGAQRCAAAGAAQSPTPTETQHARAARTRTLDTLPVFGDPAHRFVTSPPRKTCEIVGRHAPSPGPPPRPRRCASLERGGIFDERSAIAMRAHERERIRRRSRRSIELKPTQRERRNRGAYVGGESLEKPRVKRHGLGRMTRAARHVGQQE